MKGIFIILDGMADLPCDSLDGRTPLEAAYKPNLDFLASHGELGIMIPVREGYTPGSDEALLSIFGNEIYAASRGQIEAVGAGIKLVRGDLALRTNFATIDSLKSGNVIDRRAGRTLTTKEAEILGKAINKQVKLAVPFIFKPTLQHRGVLVLKGGFSDSISNVDIEYSSKGKNVSGGRLKLAQALDDEENTEYTANIVNDFLEQSYNVLKEHPVNKFREQKGLLPANFLLLRGAGIESPSIVKYSKWAGCVYMTLEIGFSKLAGMDVYSFKYPKLKNFDAYGNLYMGLKKACKFAIKAIKKAKRKDMDYMYIHIKETDTPGHDGKALEKKQMIEYIDKTLIDYVVKFARTNSIKILITADHSTPCKMKSHSADPVPVLFYSGSEIKNQKFCEKDALRGKLGKILGKELLKKVGFVKKK